MSLPNLSHMMNVGQLRYIQSRFEAAENRNPDSAVGAFLSDRQRFACIVRGTFLLSRLRANPFYHYLLARTKYYDDIFLNAVSGSIRSIINIGCGSDTRAYRFAQFLNQRRVTAIECDQPESIQKKQQIARRYWPTDHVTYISLDLNDAKWADLTRVLEEGRQEPVMVIMEGVSPYINAKSFRAFLRDLASRLHPDSVLAYDFKIAGAKNTFGCSAKVQHPFRLPAGRKEIVAYHDELGFRVEHMELSTELSKRLLTGDSLSFDFDEDCLLQLTPSNRIS